eukprot:TRINITY_DN14368_c0_g3_i1.p1 TRINITY_DN14368_c0_g3~~TRINITY_DN14368_c0_g3_i1.p1  ORF type:complete len:397 (+),score=42.81 TRINITY_DN14368_c0_g3_i1:276-1466(+)
MERHIFREGYLAKVAPTHGITHEIRKRRQPSPARIMESVLTGHGEEHYLKGIADGVIVKKLGQQPCPWAEPVCMAFAEWQGSADDGQIRGGAYVYTPEKTKPNTCVLYIHGGSFKNFSPITGGYDSFCSRLAARSGLQVVCPDHILVQCGRSKKAVAIMNQLAVDLEWLAKCDPNTQTSRDSTAEVFIMGDSSGACQALSLLNLVARDRHQLLPALRGVVLLSPWMDLSCCSTTYISNAYGSGGHTGDICWPRPAHLHPRMSRDTAVEYLGSEKLLNDPVFSPYWLCRKQGTDLVQILTKHSFPIWILAGGSEVLLGEVMDFTMRLRDALKIQLWVHEGMFHDFIFYESKDSRDTQTSKAAWDNMLSFFSQTLNAPSAVQTGINYWIEEWDSTAGY